MWQSSLPPEIQKSIDALPSDAHPMAILLTGLCALSTFHPEQNPALAGQSIYNSVEVQDNQIVRLIGKVIIEALENNHELSISFWLACSLVNSVISHWAGRLFSGCGHECQVGHVS